MFKIALTVRNKIHESFYEVMGKSDRDTYPEMYLISGKQFGFMSGRSTIEAIHLTRQIISFIGLEKET